MENRPLRLITGSPVDALARTVEALLVVASAPLDVAELAEAAADDPERIETALGLLRERYREGRCGIVLEHVAGGYAFRAAREAGEACARLFERPVERGLSQAALETLAVVAYLGPCSRPEIARIRGVAADSAVASLVERGLIAEAGRESGPGRCGALPHDATLRAGLCARDPRGAAAARRPRRRRGGDPRASARGCRGAGLVARVTRIGIFVFEGAEELDWAGPWEVLAAWASMWPDDGVEVFTVAQARGPITCAKGLCVLPDQTWETAPAVDVLLVPGGAGTRPLTRHDATLDWIRAHAAGGVLVTSVCTGALVLAAAGLLHERPATTYWSAFDELLALDPTIEPRPDDRFVDDGEVVTAAGVSAGIDMALHLVARLHSFERARDVRRYIQYDPQPPV